MNISANTKSNKRIIINSSEARERIINGNEANIMEYPYMAVVIVEFGNNDDDIMTDIKLCGGSLVAPNVVLTAAHCRGETQRIIMGAQNLFATNLEEPDREYFNVVKEIIHPEYSNTGVVMFDAMLLILDADSTYDLVHLDGFGNHMQSLNHDEPLTTIGFGKPKLGGASSSGDDVLLVSETLLQSVIQYVDPIICKSLFGSASDETIVLDTNIHLCAGSSSSASCSGDSGGPLLKKFQNNNTSVQVGLVSWGPAGCLLPPFPVVYTDIAAIYPWVSETSCAWASSSAICRDHRSREPPSPSPSVSPTITGNPTSPPSESAQLSSHQVDSASASVTKFTSLANIHMIKSICFVSWLLYC